MIMRFFKYFRISPSTFEKLLRIVAPDITKTETKMCVPICAQERLAIAIRYLATGDAHTTMTYNNSQLGFAIENNMLKIPEDSNIFNNCDKILPYVFVADDALVLKRHMMKPNAKKCNRNHKS